MSARPPRTEPASRHGLDTLSLAARAARARTGSTYRSSRGKAVESRIRPARINSRPGPGSTTMAQPRPNRVAPAVTRSRCLTFPIHSPAHAVRDGSPAG